MILTEEFLNKVLNYFDSLGNELQSSDELDAQTSKIDDNHLVISITRKVDPDKKKFDEFIDSCSAFQWEYITNNFERITGKSLQKINELYTNKQYHEVMELFKLVTKEIADEFYFLVNKK